MSLECLIIGGGFHGTALSFALTHRGRLPREKLRVLDPHAQPLALWHRFSQNVGMRYLRSPYVHHLHYDPWSLRTFAETLRGKPLASYIPLFNRPSLELLNAYHEWLIGHYQLDALRLRGRALGLRRVGDGWQVETDSGSITARNVLLAMGSTEQPRIPDWAWGLAHCDHIFAPGFERSALPTGKHYAVIGGGLSAIQTALSLASSPENQVTLIMRHALRISHFDADPCWVTRLCMEDFLKEPDLMQRRRMITQARAQGSVPPNVNERLRKALEAGTLALLHAEVGSATQTESGLHLRLTDGQTLSVAHVILATGFDARRPGGAWLDALIAESGLPLAPDSSPRIDSSLRWAEGLYVTGPLAELELGPVARNFIGARLAGERLVHVL